VASTGQPREEAAAEAVRNAVITAHQGFERLAIPGRRLVALPAIRFGGGGDRQERLKSARAQLVAAREALGQCPGTDVVFVVYKPDDYQVYLKARQEVRHAAPGEWASAEETRVPPQLVEAVRKGECVLFIGSGVSMDAGLPDWGELIDHLAGALGIVPENHRTDLDYYLDLAQWYVESEAEERQPLHDVIREKFGSSAGRASPTLAQYLLMSLPVRYVVTTNYDDLLERTLDALRRFPVKVVRQSDVAETGRRDGSFVVKFHGDADDPESIILSRDQYDSFFQKRPAMTALLEGLLLNQTFFFVGYSLRDPDFRQIHSRVATMLEEAKRPAFATTLGEVTPHAARQWSKKQVRLVPILGETLEDQKQNLLRFLDRLAEQATGSQRLFLAPDAHPEDARGGDRLTPLRDQLRAAGRVVEETLRASEGSGGGLEPAEVEQIEWVLRFLTDHGWRPETWVEDVGPGSLWKAWWRLAHLTRDRHARRRMLVAALEHTETLEDAERIRRELETIPGPR
jgi:hypothetical protein